MEFNFPGLQSEYVLFKIQFTWCNFTPFVALNNISGLV